MPKHARARLYRVMHAVQLSRQGMRAAAAAAQHPHDAQRPANGLLQLIHGLPANRCAVSLGYESANISLRLVALLPCSQADKSCSRRLGYTAVACCSLPCSHADEDAGLDEAGFSVEGVEGGGDDMQLEEEGPVRALLGVQTAYNAEQPQAVEDMPSEDVAGADEQLDDVTDGQLAGDEAETVVRRETVALVTALYTITQYQELAGHAMQAARKMLPMWMLFA